MVSSEMVLDAALRTRFMTANPSSSSLIPSTKIQSMFCASRYRNPLNSSRATSSGLDPWPNENSSTQLSSLIESAVCLSLSLPLPLLLLLLLDPLHAVVSDGEDVNEVRRIPNRFLPSSFNFAISFRIRLYCFDVDARGDDVDDGDDVADDADDVDDSDVDENVDATDPDPPVSTVTSGAIYSTRTTSASGE